MSLLTLVFICSFCSDFTVVGLRALTRDLDRDLRDFDPGLARDLDLEARDLDRLVLLLLGLLSVSLSVSQT